MSRARIAFIVLVLTVLSITPPAAHAAAPPTLAPGALRAGQRAVVRTVFAGTAIDTFGAEIIGVLRGGRAGGDLIIARATSERVVRSGIAQGMSGSPVTVDGRLIGALSSGWAFTREPVFGITPIDEMLTILDHPDAADAAGANVPDGGRNGAADAARTFGAYRWRDVGDAAATPDGSAHGNDPFETPAARAGANGASDLVPLMLPVACGGLHAAALEIARDWLTPLGLRAVPGGTSSGGAAPSLEPGSAAAVELMRGDLRLAAIGTVTWRDGDRVLLFGHPFFHAGDVRMPLAAAEIVTVIANQQISFKLGAGANAVGVVTQDRRAGVAGRMGGTAPLMPVTVAVEGARAQAFRFESIVDRTLSPMLIAIAALNSVLESGGVGARQTLRWSLLLHRAGAPPLEIADVASGESPPAEMAQGLLAPLGFLWNNPFERLAIDSVHVRVQVMPGRARWTLQSARILDPAVRPGGQVRVLAEVERWQGRREHRTLTVTVPAEAPDGRYALFVGGSAELQRFEARALPGRYRPTSLDDAWHRLAAMRPSEGLYAMLTALAPEVTSDGRDYPELPLSALSLLAPSQAAGAIARRGSLAILDEQRLDVDGPVQGQLLLSITVDRRSP